MTSKNEIALNNYNISIFTVDCILYVYVYNMHYFYLIKLSVCTTTFLKNQNCLEVTSKGILEKNKIINNFKTFSNQFFFYEFSKVKFKGKGYKIRKSSNKSLILLFNRAHITVMWWQNILIKRYRKYKFYLKLSLKNKSIVQDIVGIRPINIFTKKGLRQSRQLIFKKKGKK